MAITLLWVTAIDAAPKKDINPTEYSDMSNDGTVDYNYLALFSTEYLGQSVDIEVGHPQPDPAFYQALGDAYAFSGRFDQAERNYRIHLQHSPNDVKTLQNLSSTLIMLQHYDQARLIIQQWLAVSPDDPAALMNLSLLKDE